MKRLLLALFIISTTTLWAEKYALVVGVNDIRGGHGLYTDIDLEIISRLLNRAGFKIKTLRAKNASLKKVREELKKFYKLKPTDTFIFYYTGHGARMKGVNPNEPIDNFLALNQTYFINGDTIGGGVLTDNEFSMHLHQIRAKKITIIDACHSATIYKDLGTKEFVKSIHPKGAKTIFNRANNIQNFQSYPPKNLINISAALDTQEAENSPIGSIFTVALVNLIKKNPNITFKTLEHRLQNQIRPTALTIAQKIKNRYPAYAGLEGKFTPIITTASPLKKTILVKDIFVKPAKPTPTLIPTPTPSLATVITQNPKHQLQIKTSNGKKSYRLNRPIKLNIFSKIKHGYLYIFEQKRNSYKFLDQKELKECQNIGTEQLCKIDTIYASKPIGKSVIYAVVTKNPLVIDKKELQKDSIIEQLKENKIDGIKFDINVISR